MAHKKMKKETSLTKAKTTLLSGPGPATGGFWCADATFDDTRRLIGKSFAGAKDSSGEPVVEWLQYSLEYPSHAVKVETTIFSLSFSIKKIMANNGVSFAKKTQDGNLAGIVVLVERDFSNGKVNWFSQLSDNTRDMLLFFKLLKAGEVPVFFTSKDHKDQREGFLKRVKSLEILTEWEEEYGPKGKHWHFHHVAVDPDQQGKGVGSELMKRVCELADAEKIDCYLETGKESTKRFYEKFGFRLVATKVIEGESGPSLTLYLMTRPHQQQPEAE